MKILLVGTNSIHVSSYINAMDTELYEVNFISEEVCNFKGVKQEFLVNFRSLNPLDIIRNYRKLKKIIKNLKPDVIHIHQVTRLAYFVTKISSQLKIRTITTAWGTDVLQIPKQNKFFYFLVKQSLKRSDVITADAQIMIDEMKEMEPSANKYLLLQYGIDKVQATKKEKIVYSNRLHKKNYRIDQIIRYFSEFVEINSDWKLIVASSGSETENFKILTETLKLGNKIEFIGWLTNVENNKWYSKSMIYISIPESDGTSVSVLEAMSAGCVPVLSDIPVSHEWIENGKNGIIESKNKNPLFEALNIDLESCSKINNELIDAKATRQASMKVFYNLYTN